MTHQPIIKRLMNNGFIPVSESQYKYKNVYVTFSAKKGIAVSVHKHKEFTPTTLWDGFNPKYIPSKN